MVDQVQDQESKSLIVKQTVFQEILLDGFAHLEKKLQILLECFSHFQYLTSGKFIFQMCIVEEKELIFLFSIPFVILFLESGFFLSYCIVNHLVISNWGGELS